MLPAPQTQRYALNWLSSTVLTSSLRSTECTSSSFQTTSVTMNLMLTLTLISTIHGSPRLRSRSPEQFCQVLNLRTMSMLKLRSWKTVSLRVLLRNSTWRTTKHGRRPRSDWVMETRSLSRSLSKTSTPTNRLVSVSLFASMKVKHLMNATSLSNGKNSNWLHVKVSMPLQKQKLLVASLCLSTVNVNGLVLGHLSMATGLSHNQTPTMIRRKVHLMDWDFQL